MPQSALRRLAEGGLAAFPPDDLANLATLTRDFCWATGDVRYCVLSDAIAVIEQLWEDAVETSLVSRVDRVLADRLPAVLNETDPEVARVLALSCREHVLEAVRGV